ncbi:polysaccharide deacetylase family protein [Streptosporangium sp. NPDC051022]|uniref:polysaccharide deacetylase family protein n=1 Tax=Streptosporangium sp. NPDC051022 TaxID=3155752 RepID=UPI00342177AD
MTDDAERPGAVGRRLVLRLGAVVTLGATVACSSSPDGNEREADAGRLPGRTGDAETGRNAGGPEPAARPAPARSTVPAPAAPRRRNPPPEVRNGPRDRPRIALTFHGAGPVRLAESVLAEAERHDARLTVLAVGTWLDRYPGMARRVLSGGHDLGNHTQRHLDISAMDEGAAYAEIAECAARLRELTGSIGSWFRPSAARHATPLVRGLAARVGYRTCLSYDVDSYDHTDPGSAVVTANVLDTVRPGSIVSLHLGHPGTAEALPGILTGLRRRRLRAVTVTELLTS